MVVTESTTELAMSNIMLQRRQSEKVRSSIRTDRNQWVVSHVIRSNMALVPSNPEELIYRTRSLTQLYHIQSVAYLSASIGCGGVVGGVVSATALEAVTGSSGLAYLTVSAAGGPLEIILATAGLMAFLGASMWMMNEMKKYQDEPKIRENLNDLIKESLEL